MTTKTKQSITSFRNILSEIDFSNVVENGTVKSAFIDALLENINNIEKEYEKEVQDIESSDILESTGYSYSGISKIINNEPELKNELLYTIDEQYCKLRDVYEIYKQKTNDIHGKLRHIVSCFLYFHQTLIDNKTLTENKLTYCKANGDNVLIHIEGANQIKYTYYKRADLS